MRKFSMENLLTKDLKLVEKRKLIIIIPCAILIIGLIVMGIFWGVTGSPLKLGSDFTGGYTVQIKAGTKINEETFDEHKAAVIDFMGNYTYEKDGVEYRVRFDSNNGIRRLGSGIDTSMRIEFRAPANIAKGDVDDLMEDLSEDLAEELNKLVGYETPEITKSGNTVTAKYSMAVLSYKSLFETQLNDAGISFNNLTVIENADVISDTLTFELTGTADDTKLKEALTIADPYSAMALKTDMIGGSVSSDLVYKAITAALIALALMMIYIIIRFEFASAVASIVALIHDVAIMFVFMIVCRIEFNSVFIAGLITILAYSINNSIIIFDRIRENKKVLISKDKNITSNQIANKAIIETLGRSFTTTFTTLIMIVMVVIVCAIGGIVDMVNFGLPIIVGLIAGLYSSTLIAPMIWASMRKRDLTLRKPIFKKPVKEAVTTAAAPTAEEA